MHPRRCRHFVGWNELADVDALMWDQGYLDGTQMACAFQLLHSRDLIWSRMMREYLLGKHTMPTDLMAWNAYSNPRLSWQQGIAAPLAANPALSSSNPAS